MTCARFWNVQYCSWCGEDRRQSALPPDGAARLRGGDRVPFKDNAVQGGWFAVCAFGLMIGAARQWTRHRKRQAAAMAILALLFFADIFLIYVSKTGMLEAFALLGLLLVSFGGWRRALLISIPAVLIVALALALSAPARQRLTEFASDMRAGSVSQESVSTASRQD